MPRTLTDHETRNAATGGKALALAERALREGSHVAAWLLEGEIRDYDRGTWRKAWGGATEASRTAVRGWLELAWSRRAGVVTITDDGTAEIERLVELALTPLAR